MWPLLLPLLLLLELLLVQLGQQSSQVASLTDPGLSMFPRVFCMYWSLSFSFFSSSTFCRISALSKPLKSAALVGRTCTISLAPRTVVLLTVAAWNGARVLSIVWPTDESHNSASGKLSRACRNYVTVTKAIQTFASQGTSRS